MEVPGGRGDASRLCETLLLKGKKALGMGRWDLSHYSLKQAGISWQECDEPDAQTTTAAYCRLNYGTCQSISRRADALKEYLAADERHGNARVAVIAGELRVVRQKRL